MRCTFPSPTAQSTVLHLQDLQLKNRVTLVAWKITGRMSTLRVKVKIKIKIKVKYLYLSWITLSATWAVLPRSPVRAIPHGSSVITGGNRSTWRKPVVLGGDKLDNTLLTCHQGNFSHITPRSRNRILVTVVRDTCTTTVPPVTSGFVKSPDLKAGKLRSLKRRKGGDCCSCGTDLQRF